MYTWLRKSLNKKDDKGFTLIELLVVIIIIGILAAIAIPIFLNQRKKAVDAGSKSDARTIATQLETFYTDAQVYPTAAQFVYVGPTATTPGTIDIGSEKVVLSAGNAAVAYVNATGNAFCVEVSNPKGTRTFVWQSDAGGLLPDAVADVCDPAIFLAAGLL